MAQEVETRVRLLVTAGRLIWEQSYGSVSVDEICIRADVRKGSFYYFFPSKSDLAVAAMEDQWQKSRVFLDQVFSPQVKPLDRIVHFCESIYQRQKEKQKETGKVCGCPYASMASELSTQDEKVRLKSVEIMERYCTYLENALRDAREEGLVTDRDLKARARDVYHQMAGALLQARIQNDVEVLRPLRCSVLRLLGISEKSKV